MLLVIPAREKSRRAGTSRPTDGVGRGGLPDRPQTALGSRKSKKGNTYFCTDVSIDCVRALPVTKKPPQLLAKLRRLVGNLSLSAPQPPGPQVSPPQKCYPLVRRRRNTTMPVRLIASNAHVVGSGTTFRLPDTSLKVSVCPPLDNVQVLSASPTLHVPA